MSESQGYQRVADALSRLGYSQDASEMHGAICGALCVSRTGDLDPLSLLEREGAAVADGDAERAVRELCGAAAAALQSTEMQFGPLLPDDAADLPRRVRALSCWCEGFLLGLASGRPLDIKQCSPELKEVIKDFTEFTGAEMDDGGDTELEENAYAELVEYIRVGAQLVFLELQQPSGEMRVH